MSHRGMVIFSGNAHRNLAERICVHLHSPLGKVVIGRFSDGEVMVDIEENVRGKDVFIVQPTSAPTNDNLMELLVLADAARRASAYRITTVIPYLGYARQDRRMRSARVPITAKLVAKMISAAGVDRVLTVDLHSDQKFCQIMAGVPGFEPGMQGSKPCALTAWPYPNVVIICRISQR